jgi:hypothetical protein
VIVVDLGCATHDGEESIGPLIEHYDPDLFLGFDPSPTLVESEGMEDGVMIVLKRMAAWIEDGEIPFVAEGLRSRVGEGLARVPCFDLAVFLAALPATDGLIVKFDVEGAEVPLLERLHETEVDGRIRECLVEWHDDKPYWPPGYDERRARLLERLRCRVDPWEAFAT